MHVKTIAAGAGAAAAVLLSAPPAPAADTGIGIRPGQAMRGETVTVVGGCARSGNKEVRLVSRALYAPPTGVDTNGRFSFPATVRTVKPGTYTVTAICEPSTTSGTARFRVVDGPAGHGADEPPRGGVATGGGGTAGGQESAPVPALLLGAVVAAGAGGVVLLRRRVKN